MIATILALYLFHVVSAATAANFLFVTGALLIAGEIALGTFWLVGLNGIIALYLGYMIATGDTTILGVPIGWGFFFGVAFVEFAVLAFAASIVIKLRRKKPTVGAESLVGHHAKIVSWDGVSGQVSIQGEIWSAISDNALTASKGDKVTVESLDGLTLKIKA